MTRPAARTLISAAIVLIAASPAKADERQLQALLAKHFLQIHHAIPLSNNGAVKSGDVLHLPDEATFVSRGKCYNLPPVRYLGLRSEFMQASFEVAGAAGGEMPFEKIAEIEAEVGGKLRQKASLLIDPLSEEEPPGGLAALEKPNMAPDCAVIGAIIAGRTQDYILVTRVFHGALSALASLDLAGTAKISADLDSKIQTIVGSTPKVHANVSGSTLTLQYSKSPAPHSLAVQSAVINPDRLAHLYLRYRTGNGIELEELVYEYLTGLQPDLLTSLRIRIDAVLKILETRHSTAAAFYAFLFGGEGAIPLDGAEISQEQWNAVATIAAAHKIVENPPQ